MNLLALDLGTNCGYAFGRVGDKFPWSGVFDFKSRRYEGGGMRYLRFEEKLHEMHRAKQLDHVVFEEVRRHMSTDAAHVHGGLLGVLTAFCEKHKIPYEGYPVATIKKFATGKGNAKKDAMIAAMEALGLKPKDDNEADAQALWLLARSLKPARGCEDLL